MQRATVVGVALTAAVLGLGGGYLLGRSGPEPTPPPELGSAPQDPDAPNAIAALATGKAGGPVVPQPGGSALRFTLVSFTVGLPGEAAANQSAVEPCVRAAVGVAQDVLAGGPAPSGVLNTGACDDKPAALRGRLRLSMRPSTPTVGRPSPGAYNCEATLRWDIALDDTPEEMQSSAYGDTAATACETASGVVVAALLGRI